MYTLFTDAMKTAKGLVARNDDDVIDRLNHRWTVIIIAVLAGVTLAKQMGAGGSVISCWVPAHFHGSHEMYTNSYCWVKNTYYLPMEDYIPAEHEHEKRWELVYYQWVPLILMLQAMMFFMPIGVWRSLNARSGLDLNDIVEYSEKLQMDRKFDQASREKRLKLIVSTIDKSLESGKDKAIKDHAVTGIFRLKKLLLTCFFCVGRRLGNYVVVLYVVVKILFMVNLVAQFHILNTFLDVNFMMYGHDLVMRWKRGEDWSISRRFPRVTMCDFKIRRLGNIHRYTVQCTLPINLFNEKIFLFLWTWLLVLVLLNTINLFTWLSRLMRPEERFLFIRKHLTPTVDGRVFAARDPEHARLLHSFVNTYLCQDGVFLFRLINYNTTNIVTTSILQRLWQLYCSRHSSAQLKSDLDRLDEEQPDSEDDDDVINDSNENLIKRPKMALDEPNGLSTLRVRKDKHSKGHNVNLLPACIANLDSIWEGLRMNRPLIGMVVRRRDLWRAVEVRVQQMKMDEKINMFYPFNEHYWAEDHNNSFSAGDIVVIRPSKNPQSDTVQHYVEETVVQVGNAVDPITGRRCRGREFIDDTRRTFSKLTYSTGTQGQLTGEST